MLTLHLGLDRLAAVDRHMASVLELSCFAGMNRQEIAVLQDVSLPTVDRDLRFGRAWLKEVMA